MFLQIIPPAVRRELVISFVENVDLLSPELAEHGLGYFAFAPHFPFPLRIAPTDGPIPRTRCSSTARPTLYAKTVLNSDFSRILQGYILIDSSLPNEGGSGHPAKFLEEFRQRMDLIPQNAPKREQSRLPRL